MSPRVSPFLVLAALLTVGAWGRLTSPFFFSAKACQRW